MSSWRILLIIFKILVFLDKNDAKIRFCRRSSSCHPCSPGAELAQSRDPPTSGASSPPAMQTGGPQKSSRDYCHDFCRTNISLYTSSWSLWETHSFIMKTYEVEDHSLLIRWMGFSRTSQSRHHLICKSVVLGSRHLGHRCTLRAFFKDELLTSITQLGWEWNDCWQNCEDCDILKYWNLHPYFDLEGDSQVLTCKCQTSLSSQA